MNRRAYARNCLTSPISRRAPATPGTRFASDEASRPATRVVAFRLMASPIECRDDMAEKELEFSRTKGR
jgi:hypothetical protein